MVIINGKLGFASKKEASKIPFTKDLKANEKEGIIPSAKISNSLNRIKRTYNGA